MKLLFSFHSMVLGLATLLACSSVQAQLPAALSFDGVNDFVSVSLPDPPVSDYTFSAWVYLRAGGVYSGTRMAVLSSTSCGASVELLIRANTENPADPQYVELGRCNGFNGVPSTQPVPLNTWTHVAATVSATKTVSYYINGNPAGTWTDASKNFGLGSSVTLGDNSARKFNGQLDEVQIWNRVLSQEEIQTNLSRSLTGSENGLYAYYGCNEGSGLTAASVPPGRNATLNNGTAWVASTAPVAPLTAASPQSPVALTFDGVNDYVSVPHTNTLNAYPLTVTCWLKTTGVGSARGVVNKYVSASGNGWQIYIDSGNVRAWYFNANGGSVTTLNGAYVGDGNWHQVAFTVDASGGKIYVDGSLNQSLPWSGPSGACTTTQELRFGHYPGGSYFNGQLDEVAIWNIARTGVEIQGRMNESLVGNETNLVAYFRLNEGSGQTTGSLPSGLSGTLTNGTSWTNSTAPIGPATAEPIPTALRFDGFNDYVSIHDLGTLNQFPLTAAFWMKASFGQGTLLGKGNPTSNNQWRIYLEGNQLRAEYSRLGDPFDLLSAGPVDNLWHHVAFTVDSEGGRIYLDGVLGDSNEWNGSAFPVTTVEDLRFAYGPPVNYFGGELDEVSFWNTILSEAQIQDTMGRVLIGNEPNLVAYYPFNEGRGETTASFSSSPVPSGVLTNGPLWIASGAPVGPPAVTTLFAVPVTSTNAAMNAIVNPRGAATTAWFQYGLTAGYGNTTAITNLGNEVSPFSLSTVAGSLIPGQIYHYRIVAGNSRGTNFGADATLITEAAAPGVTTLSASNITATSASVNGSVNPNGAAATASFQYGLTTNYGNVTAMTNLPSGITPLTITAPLTGLQPAQTYHYRVIAGNNIGTNFGSDSAFTTLPPPPPPTVVTLVASNVTAIAATLNASVNPNGAPTAAWFNYGTTTNGFNTAFIDVGVGLIPMSVRTDVSGLVPGTVYHYRAVATNWSGPAAGANSNFTTLAAPPGAASLAATDVIGSKATLHGTVTPNGAQTVAWFEYGTNTNYGSQMPATSQGPFNTRLALNLGQYADVGSGISLSNISFSVEFWARNGGTGGGFVLGHGAAFDSDQFLHVGFRASGAFTFAFWGNDLDTPPIADTKWHHWACTLDANDRTRKIYRDGALVASDIAVTNFLGTGPFYIGKVGDNSFQGEVSEVRVWNSPLSQSTIQSAMDRRLAPSHPAYASLLAYWPLSEGIGTNVFDVSGKGHHGLLVNGPAWSNAPFPLNARLTGLLPMMTYHFRAVSSNSLGIAIGQDISFTSLARSVFGITNLNDGGPGSLRQAILEANASTNPCLLNLTNLSGILTLTSTLPVIAQDMTLNGPGATNLTISGGGLFRVFFVDAENDTVAFNHLTIANGRAKGGNGGNGQYTGGGGLGAGGGLFVNAGKVILSDVNFTGNSAAGGNGGNAGAGSGGTGGGGGLGGDGGTGNNFGGGGGGGFGGRGGSGSSGGGGGYSGDGGNALLGGAGGGGALGSGQDGQTYTGGSGADGLGGDGGSYEIGQRSGKNGLTYGGGGGAANWLGAATDYDAHAGDGNKFGGGGGGGYFATAGAGGDFGGWWRSGALVSCHPSEFFAECRCPAEGCNPPPGERARSSRPGSIFNRMRTWVAGSVRSFVRLTRTVD